MADWKVPAECKYTENDEWILVEGDTAKIGLTDYAQDQLSDIVYVDFGDVEVGSAITQGEAFVSVESVKAASDVYAPASGEVLALNETLEDTPEVINSDPYGEGWLVQINLSDPSELEKLMDADAYAKYCESRA